MNETKRTPRYLPLVLFVLVAYWLVRYMPIHKSTAPLVWLWVKKHDALGIFTNLADGDWRAAIESLLRSVGFVWTRTVPVDPPVAVPQPQEGPQP